MKLFEHDIHIGKWRVLIQSNDIQNGAVKARHIATGAVTGDKIGDGEVKSQNIEEDAVTENKIGDREIKSRHIAPGAVTNDKLEDECITGDEIEGSTVKNGKLANDAVHARNIKDRSVISEKIGIKAIRSEHIGDRQVKAVHIDKSQLDWDHLNPDLQNIIASAGQHGIALSNEWGNSTLIGLTQKMLSEALGDVHKDGDNFVSLQQQIDEIVSGGATVNLVANPSVIFANTATDITLTASANKSASSINITGGELSEPITGSGTQVSGTDHNVNLPIGTLTYLATFIISGLQRTASCTVGIANKIYYGAGQSDAVLNTETMVFHTPAVIQPSFTQVITTVLNDYIYFEVPSEMNNITKLELYDDPSFPSELAIESVATSRAGYKAYKTVNSRLAGTHTYKIS